MCARVIRQRPALVLASVHQVALNADEVRPSHYIMVVHHGCNFELSTQVGCLSQASYGSFTAVESVSQP